MGNGLIFFGEQTLAQDELRIKMLNTGVRRLSSTGEEVKLILGNTTYNNWNSQNVNEVNIYFGGDVRDWTDEFANMLRSDVNLAGTYNITTDLVGDTIIIKRKINNACIPAPAYLWQADNFGYATTVITVTSGCTYQNPQGSDQSQYLKIFLDNTAYDVWLTPVGTSEGSLDGYSVWTPALVAQKIATTINDGGTHTATANNNVVTVIANVAETQAATTKEYPNPFRHYSNTWTYIGGTNFATYIVNKELTFTPGASNYPITVKFTPPNPIRPFWWLDSISDVLANHPFWGDYKANGWIEVLDSENGWKLEYNITGGNSGTAAAPTNWTVSTTTYISPNDTSYTITSFTNGAATPEIGHSDVLVRGKSPA